MSTRRPTLNSCYDAHVVDERQIILLTRHRQELLTGRAYVRVIPLLDGTRTVDDVLCALRDQVPAAEIFYALARLEAMGFVRPAPPEPAPQVAAFWQLLGVDADLGAARLRDARVAIHALSATTSQQGLASALQSLGMQPDIRPGEHGDGHALSVVLVDDYLDPGVDAYNRKFLARKRPFVLAKLHGPSAWLGPLFRPGDTGCWQCLATRLRHNRVIETFLERLKKRPIARPYPQATVPTLAAAATHLLATEIGKWIALDGACSLDSALITLDFSALATERHALVRRPQCIACGAGESWLTRDPVPVAVRSRPKSFTVDGGHRTRDPEATVTRYAEQMSPITGVVSTLQAADLVDSSVAPVYLSDQNTSKLSDALSVSFLKKRFRGRSGGKGKTAAQARASALCEAMERHAGVFQGDEVRVRASYRELGERAIHPNACMGFSDGQYAARDALNAGHRKLNRLVPMRLDERAVIEWSPLWSLTENTFKYLPTSYCYYGYPTPPESSPCWADSNGCAAGNCVEEAILQGFMELVERDSVALWWYNRVQRPRVDLDSFDEPYFSQLSSYYQTLGRDLWVLDLTSDLGIPTFAAVSAATSASEQAITLGFGAHFCPRLGVLRAITEANQFLPLVLERQEHEPGARAYQDEEIEIWLRDATVEQHDYLIPEADIPATQVADLAAAERGDLRDDVDACIRVASERGLDMLVLDQTRPDVGLPVVKVVVPGLRHFWRRLAPGRLYDVPVEIGWLERPLGERDLNPIAMFF